MSRFSFRIVVLASIQAWASAPYNGLAVNLPTTVGHANIVEAEYFDQGGEGEAFHDMTMENEGNVLRDNGVDIFVFKEEDSSEFYYVGAISQWEWLKYTVYNPKEGTFDIELKTSSDSADSSLVLEVDNQIIVVPLPFSGGWDSWRLPTIFSIKLPKGPLTLKLSTPTGNFHLDYVKFIRRSTPAN